MFKIIIMALLIFIGMVGYDNITDKAQPTTPVQQEQQKVSKHEKSAAMALFTSLLPPKEEWPSPVHKFYLAFNMDEVIDPIRQNPNWTSLDAMSRDIPQALIAIEDHAFYNCRRRHSARRTGQHQRRRGSAGRQHADTAVCQKCFSVARAKHGA